MARLTDPKLLSLIREALREWRAEGYVLWKRLPAEWLRKELEGPTQKSIAKLLHQHVEAGGEIDQVQERREHYRDRYEFHFDFRLTNDERRVYIETTHDESSTGPTITIVNMHDE
jgi:hypothetical protein